MTPLLKDTLERAVWTFIQGFAGVLVLSGTINVSVLQAAGIAGLMALFSFIKSLAAAKIGAPTAQGGVNTYTY